MPTLLLLAVLACGSSATAVACTPVEDGSALTGTFDGVDTDRTQVSVKLVPVAEGCGQITDIQFSGERMIVLDKQGTASFVEGDTSGELFSLDVKTQSEMGLLGLAVHPDDPERWFINYNPKAGAKRTLIAEVGPETSPRTILEVPQPYANHDAGQVQFGPDKMLYVGLGDGGSANDPEENGQDPTTLLGSMLRIDVSQEPFAVPDDNPFVGQSGYAPEIWAYGLRNPWRFSFDPEGRMVVADVGQNAWEEVDIVESGANMGWDQREGRHCFEPDTGCETEGMVDPIYEYPHEEGQSITGGYVVTHDEISELTGKYVFADFVSGRIWAISLPDQPGVDVGEPLALGDFGIQIATFGRDGDGRLYAGDFTNGIVYRIDPS